MTYSGRKLYRDKFGGKLVGICAGLGEYFEVDPTILRIVLVLVTIFSGLFIFIIPLYFLLALIIPKNHPKIIRARSSVHLAEQVSMTKSPPPFRQNAN